MNLESSRPAQRVSQRRTSRRVRGRDDFLDQRYVYWMSALVIVPRTVLEDDSPLTFPHSFIHSFIDRVGRKAVMILYDDKVEKERVDIYELKTQPEMHAMMVEKVRLDFYRAKA